MSLNGDWLTQINWIFKFFYAISEIYVAMSLAMSCEACDAEPWHKGVSGGQSQKVQRGAEDTSRAKARL